MSTPGGADSSQTSSTNPEKEFTFSALDALEETNAGAVNDTGALAGSSASPKEDPYIVARQRALTRRRTIRFSILAGLILIGIICILFVRAHHKTANPTANNVSQQYANTTIPLATLNASAGASVQNQQVLSVNGQLNVNNALVLAPGVKPTTGVAGQLFFDQTTNKLTYYDGTAFQTLAAGSEIPKVTPPTPATSIGGASGAIGLGNGLSVAGNTLSNTGVLTLQGQAGNVTLSSGGGLVINGTTLSNSGVLSLAGQNGDIAIGSGLGFSGGQLKNTGIISAVGAGTITVTNDGNGNITIDGPNGSGGGGGTVASPGGTTGKIAKFTGVQTIADSLLSESGTVVTVGGDLTVTGSLTLGTPLSVTNGGTGATTVAGARSNLSAAKSGANTDITSITGLTTALSVGQGGTGVGTLATNGVVLGNGTSGLNSVVAGASGLCLVSTGGAPTFATCPGSGGVASIDGLTGAVTIANTTAGGSTITINDASSTGKGIASFNATNFLVTAGAVNTVQDIAVTSTPTFAGLTLTNPLAVTSGGTGRNSLTSNGVLVGNGTSAVNTTTGTNGQCLVISGTTPGFATCPGSGGVSSINSQTGAVTIQGTAGSSVSTSAGVITINDATSTTKGLAAFNSTNFSVTSGTVNTVQDIATTSAPSFGQLSIVSNQATGKMLTINNTNAAATGNLLDLQLNGTSKLSVSPNGSLTTSGNLSATGTITSGLINGQTISSAANFTGSLTVAGNLAVNTIANTGALTVGVGGQSYTLQGNVSSTLKATNGTNTTTVGFQNPTANVTYNFAAASTGSYDICTTSGNCVGTGGGVATSGGTTNKLAKFTGTSSIGDSIITDNGSTVTIGGTLSVNTITPTAALTVGATTQNLTMQGAAVSITATSGANTNSLVFASPAGGSKTITIPNASGTVAVSASGPLILDSAGNLTCPTCLSGGGGGSGVSSVNSLSGALTLQGTDAASVSNGGTTITINDASSTVKGLAKFNATNLTVTSGSVNTVQDIAVTSTPTFAGLNLTSALTVGNGGTGATTATGARSNLGAAASGANSDITSLSGLTTALSVAQGGTGIATTPTNGQILIGNGTGFSLNTLTAGSGVNISNTAGNITISAPGSGTCSTCANTSLNNLASVAINTSLLPGTAGAADLGSASLPFGQLFLSGTSGSPASNNFKITGSATGARTITLPDASGTVAVSATGYLNLSAAGNLSFTGTLAVADGGTGANNAAGARTNLGAAKSGANSDITSLSGLTTALSVGQGGTGLAALTANQLLYASSTSTIAQMSNGTSGQCLISNGAGSAPSFQTCTGAGGVSSVDSLTGALTISNTTGAGATITIDDAKADGSTKGIAAFSSANFTATSGVINTIQGIATTSSPTFSSLTLSGALNTTTITPSGALTVGATGQAFTLQGSASSVITATGGGFTTSVGFNGTATGNVTYNFDRAAAAGTYTVCSTAGNCVGLGGAVTTAGGTTGKIAKFTASGAIGDSLLSESGGTVTASGNFNITTGSQYQVNGSQISSANLSNDSNLAKLNAAQTFTGTSNVFKNSSDSATAFQIQNAAGTALFTLDTTSGAITATGAVNSVNGFKYNGTSGSTTTCTSGNVIQNAVIQGGIITGGTCVANGGGTSPTLQTVYDNSGTTNPQIQLSNTNGGLKIRDASSSSIGNLFQIQDSTGGNTYFAVTSAAAKSANFDSVSGTLGIGNSTATSVTIGNTGNTASLLLQGTAGATYTIGTSNNTGGITLGNSTATNTINIGNATIAASNTGTINIGTSSTSTGKTNVTIGSTNDGSTLTLQAGTGNLNMLTNSASAKIIAKSSTNGTAAFQIQNSSSTALFNADTTNGQVTITGTNDSTQLIIKANATQSSNNPLILLQTSGGSEMARITASNNGDFFFGYGSGNSLSGGSGGNIGVGSTALAGVTTGAANIAIGNTALSFVSTTVGNTAIGFGAAQTLTGNDNVGIGRNALQNIGASDANTAVGTSAGNVTGAGANFYYNSFLGYGAGSTDTDTFATTSTLQRSTAVGYDAQVQASRTIVLGGIGTDYQQVVIGSTMGTSSNLFGVSPVIYSTGTASQSGSTITGSGTTWNTANGVRVGQRFIFANGTDGGTITAVNGTTSLTVSTSQTVGSQKYRIHNTGFQVDSSGNAYIQSTSSSAFSIQDASTTKLFNADTSTGTITFGNSASGNYITFTASGGLQAYGTARPTKYISLSAEYAGAVLYGGDTGGANCSTNQNGTMTSGYDTSSSQQSYYNWTSAQATNQCYDVVVRVPLPAGFDGWAAAPSIQVKTDNTGNSAYAIGIIKSDGSTYDTSYGSAYTSPGTLGTSWGNMSTSSLDSSGYTAGSYLTIRIRMTAKNSANLQLGDIKLAYYSKY